MHKQLCILYFLLCISPYAVGQSTNYSVKAYLDGIEEGRPVFLQQFSGINVLNVDSGNTDKNARIELLIPNNSLPGLYRLYYSVDAQGYELGRQPFVLDFIFNGQNVELQTSSSDITNRMMVVNTEDVENANYFDFLKGRYKFNQSMDSLSYAINSVDEGSNQKEALLQQFRAYQIRQQEYEAHLIKKHPNAFYPNIIQARSSYIIDGALSIEDQQASYKANFFSTDFFKNPLLLRTNIIEEGIIQYLQMHFDNRLTPPEQDEVFNKEVDRILDLAKRGNERVYEYVLNNLIMGFEMNGRIAVLEHLNDYIEETSCENAILSSASIKRLEAISRNSVGKQAANFETTDINGVDLKLSDINTEYTLITFWSSTCEHCKEVIPRLRQELLIFNNENKTSANQLTVIAVSLDTSKVELKSFLDTDDYSSWIVTSDYKGWEGEIPQAYSVYATPTFFLLDKKKKIIGKPKSGKSLVEQIQDLPPTP